MCGIVGLYSMMIAMTERGPDSAGFAIYGDAVDSGIKFTLRHEDENYDWEKLAKDIEEALVTKVDWFKNSKVAIFKVKTDADFVENYLHENHPDVLIMSAGTSIEILKEVGLPERIVNMFNLDKMQGTHIIGHTRMATESAVTMAGSHPFSTGMDLCLVHNGSLSNHNRMRQELKRNGIHFDTENDTEVAAGFLTYRLQQGDSLHQALEHALKELDGFYTFTIGTKDGFAVVRDPIACKPAVIAETDDYVAMASEYQALTTLPGIENAKVWEPEPSTIYAWERGSN